MERNADEFKRLHDMLVTVGPSAERAERHTQWKSEGSTRYEARLSEARKLLLELAEAYAKAEKTLRAYAYALAAATSHYSNGKASEQALADLIHTKGTAITRDAQQAEPMRQWEDMRATTGVLDFFAELTMDVDDIRAEADWLHAAAGGDFHLAKTTEQTARDICVHGLKQAYDLLPDFRLGFDHQVDLPSAIAQLRQEAAEAMDSPLTQLPGSGPKQGYFPLAGTEIVSPALRDIRLQVANLPTAKDSYWDTPQTAEEKTAWITANKDVIHAAARNSGVPPDMVAGIAWQEIGGQPGILDDLSDTIRESVDTPLSPIIPENLPWRLSGPPDHTSFGPIAIQIRRGAEVLGYDPANLSDQQRTMVEAALQDPAQNIFIASEYLAQLKAESGFANVPAQEMTPAHYQELAERYNGGPSWQTDDAKAYGRGFTNDLDKARSALR
ncbi:hypothetical protein [Streptomyces laurentii]|uniref:hypothetical protein n=1 Tax=Streptomyces laurentii TaxID=39478 RepID=UPI00368A6711